MALKVIFLGTPQFGVPTLQKIFEKHRLLRAYASRTRRVRAAKWSFLP